MSEKKISKWDDKLYVKAYELARTGLKGSQLAKAMGINIQTLRKWKANNPAFADAINRARKSLAGDNDVKSFLDYVYGRLDPHLQWVWGKITEWDKSDNGLQMIDALLEKEGMWVRMNMFVHALVSHNFNVSEACRLTNTSHTCFENWCDRYPDFADLIKKMHMLKQDFYENALMNLVKGGDSPAIIFANKTYNRSRGYSEKVDIEVKNQDAAHLVDITVLDLPIEVKRQILTAYRKYQEGQRKIALGEIGDEPALEYRLKGGKAVPADEADAA